MQTRIQMQRNRNPLTRTKRGKQKTVAMTESGESSEIEMEGRKE